MSGTRDGERVDDLRRRLYRADATQEDLDRYLAEQPPEPPPAPDPPAARRPSRVRPLRVVAAGLVAAAVGTAFVPATRAAPGPGPAATTAAPPVTSLVLPSTGGLVVRDIGDGRTLTVDPSASSGPIAVPARVEGVAVTGRRWFGAGNAVLRVDALPGTSDGGRMTVELTTPSTASVTWSALLLTVPAGRPASPVVLAAGGSDTTEAAGGTTFRYASRPATRLAIEAPEGAGWTLTVAVAGGLLPSGRATAAAR